MIPGAIKFLPNCSILAEVVLDPAQSLCLILVLVSLQEAPQSLTVHPVLVAETDGWEPQLQRRKYQFIKLSVSGLEVDKEMEKCLSKSKPFRPLNLIRPCQLSIIV